MNSEKTVTVPLRIAIPTLIIVGGILISIGQLVQTVRHSGTEMAEIRAEIVELRDYLETKTSDRYRAQDAAKDLAYVQERLRAIENRIDNLERNHRK